MIGGIFVNKTPKMTSAPLNPDVNCQNDVGSIISTLFDVGPPKTPTSINVCDVTFDVI